MPLLTEEEKLERKIFRRFNKAINSFGLIEDNDHILIGLSGGKDSLCLTELLSKKQKISKPNFSLEALHIRMKEIKYESNVSYLEEFCSLRGINFHLVTTSIGKIGIKKSTCFPCSWNRRKQLFLMAQALGCNKIALGHHMDDIIITTMLNLYYQGSFSSMPLKLKMRKMPLTIIRPLGLEQEEDLKTYAKLQGYKKQIKTCPYETSSQREIMKEIFSLIEKLNPEARYSFFNALEKEKKLIEL